MPYQECEGGYNSHHKQASHCIGRDNGKQRICTHKIPPFKNNKNNTRTTSRLSSYIY